MNSTATASAKILLPTVLKNLSIGSVLDVGCGCGAWLSVWEALGVADTFGVDGDYVDSTQLLIPKDQFLSADLSAGFSLGRTFDLVQCLEVAEHLPKESSALLVKSLVSHGKMILFSAAVPGQGGIHHVNEQPYEYWRRLFQEEDYLPVDLVRDSVARNTAVSPWYRYNTILYVHQALIDSLPPEVSATLVPSKKPIPDVSPCLYRVRKTILRFLPVPLMTLAARFNERLVYRRVLRGSEETVC